MFIFIIRQASRSPIKTIFVALAALLFVLAPSYLLVTIDNMRLEIDTLYETTPVLAEIKPAADPGLVSFKHNIGDTMSQVAIRAALTGKCTANEFIEAGYSWSVIVPATDEGLLPDDWDEIIGYNLDSTIFENYFAFNSLLAVNDISRFIIENSLDYSDLLPGTTRYFIMTGEKVDYFTIDFAEGFDESSFVLTPENPIPIIMSYEEMDRIGLSNGDTVYINIAILDNSGVVVLWRNAQARVIGIHNRNIIADNLAPVIAENMRDATVIPLETLEDMLGSDIGYTNFRFTVNPEKARELDDVTDVFLRIIDLNNQNSLYSGFALLDFTIQSEELRLVVKPLEQTVQLLVMLYPVVVILLTITAAVFSLLLVLQNARNAASMRVLGLRKSKVLITLALELCFVSLCGILIGVLVNSLLRWNSDSGTLAMSVCICVAGLFFGSVAGSIYLVTKPPLRLLQVKE